jgi:phenylpyruvate tautomerase PptA (4-oxalocrotonate tautomerase family)
MPYLRLSSLPLDEATKRVLADELTATVLDILPDQKPEWTTVHFTPFTPDEFAVAGRLVADGAIADTHLEISAPEVVDERAWIALRNRLTDVLVEELGIDDSERWHVNVKLNRYNPHSFAVAGNAADELPARGNVPEPSGNGWRKRLLLLGFAVAALAGSRWVASRIGSDADVDVAPPLEDSTEELASAHPS